MKLGQKSIIHSLTSRPSEAAARFERPRRRPRPGGGYRVLRGGAQAAVDPRRLKRRGDDVGKMDLNGISIREYQYINREINHQSFFWWFEMIISMV
jgi:hypothetical protein